MLYLLIAKIKTLLNKLLSAKDVGGFLSCYSKNTEMTFDQIRDKAWADSWQNRKY